MSDSGDWMHRQIKRLPARDGEGQQEGPSHPRAALMAPSSVSFACASASALATVLRAKPSTSCSTCPGRHKGSATADRGAEIFRTRPQG